MIVELIVPSILGVTKDVDVEERNDEHHEKDYYDDFTNG